MDGAALVDMVDRAEALVGVTGHLVVTALLKAATTDLPKVAMKVVAGETGLKVARLLHTPLPAFPSSPA